MVYNKYQTVTLKALKEIKNNIKRYFETEKEKIVKQIYNIAYDASDELQRRHNFLAYLPGYDRTIKRIAVEYNVAGYTERTLTCPDPSKRLARFPKDCYDETITISIRNTNFTKNKASSTVVDIDVTPELEIILSKFEELIRQERSMVDAVQKQLGAYRRLTFKDFFCYYPELEVFMERIAPEVGKKEEADEKEVELALNKLSAIVEAEDLDTIPGKFKKAPWFISFVDFIVEIKNFIENSQLFCIRRNALEEMEEELDNFRFLKANKVEVFADFGSIGTHFMNPSVTLRLLVPEYLTCKDSWKDAPQLLKLSLCDALEDPKEMFCFFENEESILCRRYFSQKWLKIKSMVQEWSI